MINYALQKQKNNQNSVNSFSNIDNNQINRTFNTTNMISLVVGGVIGVGTLVYLSRSAGAEKTTEEANPLNDSANPEEESTKNKENEVVLSDE